MISVQKSNLYFQQGLGKKADDLINISEREFEVMVDRALGILGWEEYSGDFEIRPTFQLGSTKNSLKPDFLIKSNLTGQKLFVVEIKRPKVPLSGQNQIQLSTYMRQFKLPFGILIGPEIQIFYDGPLNEQENAMVIGKIKFEKDSKDGEQFVSLFSKDSFSLEALHGVSAEFLKKNHQKTQIEQLVKRITSKDFQEQTKELIKQHLIRDYEGEIIDSALERVKIEIRSLDRLEGQILNTEKDKLSSENLKTKNPGDRDYSKFIFQGKEYNKGKLVHAVISAHVEQKPNITFSELKRDFPDSIQGSSLGVFDLTASAQGIFQRTGHKRHHINQDEIIKLQDQSISTCTQWKPSNIKAFIDQAKKLGWSIELK